MDEIKKAIELKKELGKRPALTATAEQQMLEKIRVDWSYHSCHLEGNQLSHSETQALILQGVANGGKPLRDYQEMMGHDEAVQLIYKTVAAGQALSENLIKELHKSILQKPYETEVIDQDGSKQKVWVNAGEYQKQLNYDLNDPPQLIQFAKPFEVSVLMSILVNWYAEQRSNSLLNPIRIATELHSRFTSIRPFNDGNGRTARLLMNFVLLQHGFPPAIIGTTQKRIYFAALTSADQGDLKPLSELIAKSTYQSLKMLETQDFELPQDEPIVEKETAPVAEEAIEVSKTVESQPIKEESTPKPETPAASGTSEPDDDMLDLMNSIQELGGGEPPTKNDEWIGKLILGSFKRYAKLFFEELKKFESMYNDSTPNISYEKSRRYHYVNDINTIIDSNKDIEGLCLSYIFKGLKARGVKNFDPSFYVFIRLKPTEYQFSPAQLRGSISKHYDEELSDEEIEDWVGQIVDKHKSMIQKELDKLKK